MPRIVTSDVPPFHIFTLARQISVRSRYSPYLADGLVWDQFLGS